MTKPEGITNEQYREFLREGIKDLEWEVSLLERSIRSAHDEIDRYYDVMAKLEREEGKCNSFGADPDCRPEPKFPWDNRGWQPNG